MIEGWESAESADFDRVDSVDWQIRSFEGESVHDGLVLEHRDLVRAQRRLESERII